MFIDLAIEQSASSVGAACARNQAHMPLLRSFGRLPDGFYKHVALTALRRGSGARQVFQQAVKWLASLVAGCVMGCGLQVMGSGGRGAPRGFP